MYIPLVEGHSWTIYSSEWLHGDAKQLIWGAMLLPDDGDKVAEFHSAGHDMPMAALEEIVADYLIAKGL